MASMAAREQRSRWPPRAAVRQCSMARSTLRCCQVSQDRFFSMKLLPCARMISATSRVGRVISCAACAIASPVGAGDFHRVERRWPAAFRWRAGKVKIDGGVFEVGMAEQQPEWFAGPRLLPADE